MKQNLLKLFEFLYLLIGNIIQLFIIIIFIDFLRHKFNGWLVNLYVLANCSYKVYNKMFLILLSSLIIIAILALLRYLLFKLQYIKRLKKNEKK